jgi:hypothetical protein
VVEEEFEATKGLGAPAEAVFALVAPVEQGVPDLPA